VSDPSFSYHPTILERFPSIRAGLIQAQGLANGPTPDSLLEAYRQQQRETLQQSGQRSPADIDSLQAWRSAFRRLDVNPTQYRNAAEALLRRLRKSNQVPSINLLVDAGNLISLRYLLPVAVFDAAGIQGGLQVCFAQGDETFTPLGAGGMEHPSRGEVIFVDQQGCVAARRWCWRQSAETAAKSETRQALIVIEALHRRAPQAIESALVDLTALLATYSTGTFRTATLPA
jgi:DNA/RNA-binding domain of Phe-tRNA-synthetase-like protein